MQVDASLLFGLDCTVFRMTYGVGKSLLELSVHLEQLSYSLIQAPDTGMITDLHESGWGLEMHQHCHPNITSLIELLMDSFLPLT